MKFSSDVVESDVVIPPLSLLLSLSKPVGPTVGEAVGPKLLLVCNVGAAVETGAGGAGENVGSSVASPSLSLVGAAVSRPVDYVVEVMEVEVIGKQAGSGMYVTTCIIFVLSLLRGKRIPRGNMWASEPR